ncbi:MAG: hypothetical protein KAR87_02415 [Candidatus Aenigmarchaeota archaeon]|nr:hypothetical protein [Candidatus Aenigmarchaeota archaeon]
MERRQMQKMENEIVDRITPIIEKRIEARIKHRIVQSIVDTLDENFYPPEEMIKEEYVKQIEEAEKRVKRGEGKSFKDKDELLNYLESLKE